MSKDKKKYKQNYNDTTLEMVVQLVKDGGISMRKAALAYGIPRSTIQDKVNGRTEIAARSGPKPVLSTTEEARIVEWCLEMAKIGYPRTRFELLHIVKKILDDDGRQTKFRDNLPGKDWYFSFKSRHPEISERTPNDLGKERAMVSPFKIKKWFEDFTKYMTEEVEGGMDILKDPSRLYNADESGFPLCPKTSKVLTMRGSKQVYIFFSSDKTQITVLAYTSATAHYIPPMIVYPGVRFKYNPLEGFEDAILGRSINGWMDSDLFLTWLRETFLPHIKARKVVLFVDGHSTHISLEANEFSRRENFVMYCLQQHASHIIQPLDLCLFSSLKYNWRKSVRT
ncbi:uncharacterized protein [Mytilus edulis]|uniref:uncharacterized protein n=1 Tax=Mytilus edulis TaxID=6550 RepID=UPI0039EFA0F1